MKMVGDQCPCIADGFRILEYAFQAVQKMISVGIVLEYRAPFNAPDHDMVNGSGSVNSGFPRHETRLSSWRMVCQLKNLTASPFSHKELEVLRKKVSEKPTYVMFNNNTMKEDALRFLEIIRS